MRPVEIRSVSKRKGSASRTIARSKNLRQTEVTQLDMT